MTDSKRHTLGHAYGRFMLDNDFKPEERPIVKYVPDYTLAYVMQRYREVGLLSADTGS